VYVSKGARLNNQLQCSSGCLTGWLRNYHLWFMLAMAMYTVKEKRVAERQMDRAWR